MIGGKSYAKEAILRRVSPLRWFPLRVLRPHPDFGGEIVIPTGQNSHRNVRGGRCRDGTALGRKGRQREEKEGDAALTINPDHEEIT